MERVSQQTPVACLAWAGPWPWAEGHGSELTLCFHRHGKAVYMLELFPLKTVKIRKPGPAAAGLNFSTGGIGNVELGGFQTH